MGMAQKEFKKGEVIIKEGDSGKSFFFLLEGGASVYGGFGKNNQLKIADLEAGEFFGEMAILEAYPRSATVVAKGNTRVVEIPGNEMNEFFDENPDMILELMRHLGNRIQVMTSDYAESKALLRELRGSENENAKKSLFSKIKKHIDVYQSNKNKLTDTTKSFDVKFDYFVANGAEYTKEFRKGGIICNKGDASNCMYVLLSGEVGIYDNYKKPNEEKLSSLEAISFFGEMGMFTEDPRTASAVAETDNTKVEMIDQNDIMDTYKTNPEKIDMLLRHMSYRLRRLTSDFLSACKEITENYNS